MERLRKEKEACQLKVEVLRQEKLEAERKVEEKRLEDERIQLEAEKEKELALEREMQEAMKRQRLADWKEKEDKEKEKKKKKEDEANEMVLQAVGALSASDGDSEADLADLKMAAMAELRRRQRIMKGKKKVDAPESWKCKIQSANRVEESKDEVEGASVGLSTPKCLKTEPAPQAEDKVFSGNGTWLHQVSILLVDLDVF